MGKKAPEDPDDEPWYLQRGSLLAGALLATVVVAAVVIPLVGPPSKTQATNQAPATTGQPAIETAETSTRQASSSARRQASLPASVTARSSPPAGEAGRGGSVCGLPAGSQNIPVTPPEASWQMVGHMAAPMSEVYGPAAIPDSGIGGCFAHSPTGALFAAFYTLAVANMPSVDPLSYVTQRGDPSSAGYEAALESAKRDGGATHLPADASTMRKVTFLGFRVIDYTADRAVIDVAISLGDPMRPADYRAVLVPTVMAWAGGDWLLVYPATPPTPQPITNTSQYIAWTA